MRVRAQRTVGRRRVASWSWLVPWVASRAIGPSGLVVTGLKVPHLPSGFFGPLWVARAVGDDRLDREPGPQQRPALVLLNRDAHRDALDDLGELAGDDVPRHKGELCPGRFADPHDPTAKWTVKGVEVKFDGIAGGHP